MAAPVLEDVLSPLPLVLVTRASGGTARGEDAATLVSDVDEGVDPLLAGRVSQVCDVILTSLALLCEGAGGEEEGWVGGGADARGIPFLYSLIQYFIVCCFFCVGSVLHSSISYSFIIASSSTSPLFAYSAFSSSPFSYPSSSSPSSFHWSPSPPSLLCHLSPSWHFHIHEESGMRKMLRLII